MFVFHKDKDGYFEPVPKSICAEKGWDDLDDEGKVPPFLKNILKGIEPDLNKCLDKLVNRPLSDNDRYILSTWFAILFVLSPNSLADYGNFSEKVGKLFLDTEMSKPSKYFPEKYRKFYNENKHNFDLKVNKFYTKNSAMSIVFPIAMSFYISDWHITRNETQMKFLTCDKPLHFICWNDHLNNIFNPKGIALDSDHFLWITPIDRVYHDALKKDKELDFNKYPAGKTSYGAHKTLDKQTIKAIKFINQHTIYNADRFIISSYVDKDLEGFIRKNRPFSTKHIMEEFKAGDRVAIITRLKNDFPNFEPKVTIMTDAIASANALINKNEAMALHLNKILHGE